MKPIRKTYRIKHKTPFARIPDNLKDISAYTLSDAKRLDPEFKIEYSKHGNENGYCIIIESYSVIEY